MFRQEVRRAFFRAPSMELTKLPGSSKLRA